ncbi:uncharacterized protein MELLADRAFT_40640 [Melampsora larici-populina 98AG31]|uniref:Trm112p-domain-containing protein n=1 Tax=Melampsora larici-populina (strain 98AG31 / pathotype 3-4-7) TaxID=747676 RepID=F4S950_MELLP|nr:uncharacterized protein MELLADRAFT_40640 [Melampsora larici-populina 98AG31]EGF98826.1 hypothetical protein MELLADRAFT_40640 [Melampsora larici-populina 98AG31]
MVRLITHNLLSCNSRTCSTPTNFPLKFQSITKLETIPSNFNKEFLMGFLPKLDFNALLEASRSLGDDRLPDSIPDQQIEDPNSIPDEIWLALHHALLEIHVQEGQMVCPSCSHIFVIKDGIPNMLLAEHEIHR